MRLLAASLAAILLALPAPQPARAQPAGKDGAAKDGAAKDGKAIAREHFRRGRQLHDAGQYLEAADAYLEAYRHFPAPAFLYNAGQVFRLAGEVEQALEHYRRYVELEPSGEGADNARGFIAELEAALAERARQEETRRAEEAREQEEARGQPDPGPTEPPAPIGPVVPPRDAPARPGRGLVIAGAATAGAGVVALGLAAVFGARASSRSDELSDHRGPWGPEQRELYDSGQSAETAMTISLAIGGAALATGSVLYLLGNRKNREASVALTPTASGAALVGRF